MGRLRELPISPLGLGGTALGNMFRATDDATADATVDAAWDAGVRLFDTAPLYGHGLSELRLGRALARRPRDEFVLSTKVGRLLEPGAGAETTFVDLPAVHPEFDYSRDADPSIARAESRAARPRPGRRGARPRSRRSRGRRTNGCAPGADAHA